jgi:hypothetical protein
MAMYIFIIVKKAAFDGRLIKLSMKKSRTKGPGSKPAADLHPFFTRADRSLIGR